MANMENDVERLRNHVGDILSWKADIRVALTEIKAEDDARDKEIDAIHGRLDEGNDLFEQYKTDHVTLETLRKKLKIDDDENSVVDAMIGMQKTISRLKKALWGGGGGIAYLGAGDQIMAILKGILAGTN